MSNISINVLKVNDNCRKVNIDYKLKYIIGGEGVRILVRGYLPSSGINCYSSWTVNIFPNQRFTIIPIEIRNFN